MPSISPLITSDNHWQSLSRLPCNITVFVEVEYVLNQCESILDTDQWNIVFNKLLIHSCTQFHILHSVLLWLSPLGRRATSLHPLDAWQYKLLSVIRIISRPRRPSLLVANLRCGDSSSSNDGVCLNKEARNEIVPSKEMLLWAREKGLCDGVEQFGPLRLLAWVNE